MKKNVLSLFLSLGMLCCAACSNQKDLVANTISQDENSIQNTVTSQYDGPLYEISFTKMTDILPEFQYFYRSRTYSFSSKYYAIELMTNFSKENTIPIGVHEYCDANFNLLPMDKNHLFLDYYNGYRIFLWENPDGEFGNGWALEVYDKDLNLIFTTADGYEILDFDGGYIYLKTGWVPVKEKSTSLQGFLNIYTKEWHPLSSTSESLRSGGEPLGMVAGASYYSDGLAYVTSSENARVYYSITNAKMYENEVLGFIDENGQYAFRFDELSEFDGLFVNMVSGFYDGTCAVAVRYDDGRTVAPMPSDNDSPFYEVDFVYLIDKAGKILKEISINDLYEKEEEVYKKNGQLKEFEKELEWSYHTDSIRFADGLTLSVERPLQAGEIKSSTEVGGYTITDSNGTVYPLDHYDVQRVMVTDDGQVFLYCSNIESADEPVSSGTENTMQTNKPTQYMMYRMDYKWIAPPDYTLPQGQEADFSTDGLQNYSKFEDRLVSGWCTIYDVTAESNPILEIQFEGECTNYVDGTFDIIAQESAQRSYSLLEHEYEALIRNSTENISRAIRVDMLYMFSDPNFSSADFLHSYQWNATCTWTDENNTTHSKEVFGM